MRRKRKRDCDPSKYLPLYAIPVSFYFSLGEEQKSYLHKIDGWIILNSRMAFLIDRLRRMTNRLQQNKNSLPISISLLLFGKHETKIQLSFPINLVHQLSSGSAKDTWKHSVLIFGWIELTIRSQIFYLFSELRHLFCKQWTSYPWTKEVELESKFFFAEQIAV